MVSYPCVAHTSLSLRNRSKKRKLSLIWVGQITLLLKQVRAQAAIKSDRPSRCAHRRRHRANRIK